MEFEELQMIWDQQNQKRLYVFDQEALQRRVQAKKRQASKLASLMETSLIIINLSAAIILLTRNWGEARLFSYISVAALLAIIPYLWWSRWSRKSMERQFEASLLGDLNQAISVLRLQIKRLQTMIWWYILPIAVPASLNMLMSGDKPWWQWIIVMGSFVLGYFMIDWEVKCLYQPKLRSLEKLREKLTKELREVLE